MNLIDQQTKPARIPEAPDSTSTPLDHRQNGKTRLGFKAKDFNIYPAHGVGQILSIEEQTVAGTNMEFFVIVREEQIDCSRPRPKGREHRNAQAIGYLLSPDSKTDLERNFAQRLRQLVPPCSGLREQNQLW
jgi:hypothetical protein